MVGQFGRVDHAVHMGTLKGMGRINARSDQTVHNIMPSPLGSAGIGGIIGKDI